MKCQLKFSGLGFVLISTVLSCLAHGADMKRFLFKGSTTVSPFVREAVAEYARETGVHVLVEPVPTGEGLKCVKASQCDVAIASKSLEPEEAADLDQTLLGWDGLAMIVHPSNPLKGLTRKQFIDVFCGSVVNWKDLGGPDLPVKIYNRGKGTGASELFDKYFKCHVKGQAVEQTGAVLHYLRTEPGALSYMGLGGALHEKGKVKIMELDGVSANNDNVKNGSYPIKRELLLARKKGVVNPEIDKIIMFILTTRGKLFPKFDFIESN